MPIKAIARDLEIPRSTVADIVYYRTWKSLEEAG
jgi:hypothetical protein